MPAPYSPYATLAARLLLAQLFILSGLDKATGVAHTVAAMDARGIPLADVLVYVVMAVELGCGAALALGWRARWAALILFLFVIPTTLIFHDFWAIPDAAMATQQQTQFLKNLAIMGGLLMVIIHGPGRVGLDREDAGWRWPRLLPARRFRL